MSTQREIVFERAAASFPSSKCPQCGNGILVEPFVDEADGRNFSKCRMTVHHHELRGEPPEEVIVTDIPPVVRALIERAYARGIHEERERVGSHLRAVLRYV